MDIDELEELVDDATLDAIASFPDGFTPTRDDVLSDSDVCRFERSKTWAADLFLMWRDAWGCLETSGPCPDDAAAFAAYADAIVHLTECREVLRKEYRDQGKAWFY